MTTLYTVLFIATFPALWVLAAFLDRVWPSNAEREGRRTYLRKAGDAQKP